MPLEHNCASLEPPLEWVLRLTLVGNQSVEELSYSLMNHSQCHPCLSAMTDSHSVAITSRRDWHLALRVPACALDTEVSLGPCFLQAQQLLTCIATMYTLHVAPKIGQR
eukprot:6136681-Amphidinium_carterae.1